MFEVRLRIPANDTSSLLFPRGIIQVYSSLNSNKCFDIDACNTNDRQLTFQYFYSFSVDLITVSADHEVFSFMVHQPHSSINQQRVNYKSVGYTVLPFRTKSDQLFLINFQRANHYVVYFCRTVLLFSGSASSNFLWSAVF